MSAVWTPCGPCGATGSVELPWPDPSSIPPNVTLLSPGREPCTACGGWAGAFTGDPVTVEVAWTLLRDLFGVDPAYFGLDAFPISGGPETVRVLEELCRRADLLGGAR